MIKKLIGLATITALVIVVGLAALDSGWILVPEWYQKTTRYQARSLEEKLLSIALSYEKMGILPQADSVEILEEKSDRWGTPIQYSYENDEAVLRAAGKDQKLNTNDDIKQKVRITSGYGMARSVTKIWIIQTIGGRHEH